MTVFEPDMQEQITEFLVQLLRSSKENSVVNMTPRCERLGVDIVGKLAFGYSLNTQSNAEHRVMIQGMKQRSDRSALYFWWNDLEVLEPLFNKLAGRQSMDGLYKSIQTMIAARMAKPRDAFHDFYALTSGDLARGEPGLVTKELWAEAVFFVAAGMYLLRRQLSNAEGANHVSRWKYDRDGHERHVLLSLAEPRRLCAISLRDQDNIFNGKGHTSRESAQ
jgi:hypothetical protein